ncbi:MAG: hypothetical protein V4528_05850 [Pseudomonadota bacterium]
MKRLIGMAMLVTLGSASCLLDIYAYFKDIDTIKMLIFNAVIAGFGLYVFGAIFFDYPITFRTTINPTDPWGMRLFQASVGLFLWGMTFFGLFIQFL